MSSRRISRRVSSSSPGSSNPDSLRSPGKVMFDDSLALLGDQELQHLNIALMEQPLESGGSNIVIKHFNTPHGTVFKHGYFLLQYDDGKWIMAEKGGESAPGMNDAGITLSRVNDLDVPEDLKAIDDSSIRFQTNNIVLGKGKNRWSLAQMFKLLSTGDPNYHIMDGNCWKYAYDCAERVLNWCIHNAEAEDVRYALKAQLHELKRRKRPGPGHLMRSVLYPLAPESVEASEKFKQKLADTQERLPEDAHRRFFVKAIRKVIDPKSRSGDKAEPRD